MARQVVVPEFGDRDAGHVAADNGPGGVCGDDGHDDVAGEAEGLEGEDAEVLEENGEFGEG